jgi:hypothetical protein
MSTGKPAGKRSTGVTEVKLMLTAGTLAATLLGWAALALRSEAAQPAQPKTDEGPVAVPPSLAFLAEPLPTVAAPGQPILGITAEATPTGLRSVDAPPPVQVITVSRPSGGGSGGSGTGQTASSQ